MFKVVLGKIAKSRLCLAVVFSASMLAFLLLLHANLFNNIPIAAKFGIFLVFFSGSYLFLISESDHINKKRSTDKVSKSGNLKEYKAKGKKS